MEKLSDLWLVGARVATIFPLMLIAALFMGKRSVGELPVFDVLIVLSIGSVVGADIADPQVEHAHTVAALIFIVALERAYAWGAVRFRRFRNVTSFEPTVVVHRGKLLEQNIRGIRYTVDQILQMLREKEAFDVSEVELAVVEGNGELTVLQKGKAHVPPLIVEGILREDELRNQQRSREWLEGELRNQGIAGVGDVFFAAVGSDGRLHVSRRNESTADVPRMPD